MGVIEACVLILVAVIGAVATLWSTVRSNRRTRAENDEQHAAGQLLIAHLADQVGVAADRLGEVHTEVVAIKDWQIGHLEDFHSGRPD
jgi:hypothetical protein